VLDKSVTESAKSGTGSLSPRRGRVKTVSLSPLARRSTSRANPNALEESTWLVRACQLKSVKGGDNFGTGAAVSDKTSPSRLVRGLPSMAIVRAATCPFHTLHPSQHNDERAELVRWCLTGDNAGTGVILYPEVMPKHLREPLARQEVEMHRCPFCQQCIARCEVLKQEEEEARAAQKLRRRREKQLHELQKTMAAVPVNGIRLEAATKAWEFEQSNDDFVVASRLLAEYRQAAKTVETLVKERPPRLAELYTAVAAWQFDEDSTGCPALGEAQILLAQYTEAVQAAVSASDGWALNRLWEGLHVALGSAGQELAIEASALHGKHTATTVELRRLMSSAPNLEAAHKIEIERICQEWAFSVDDPCLQLGHAWLRFHEDTAKRCAKELGLAASTGSAEIVRSAMSRRQALQDNAPEVVAADAVRDTFNCACQAAGAIAFGKTLAPVPLPGTPYALCEAAAIKAQQVLDTITEEHIKEVETFSQSQPGVLEIASVITYLLSGVGHLPKVPQGQPSVDSIKAFLLHAELLQHLAFVLSRVGVGHWDNISRARIAFTNFERYLDRVWCTEMLGTHSLFAAALFEFMKHTFDYYDLLRKASLDSGATGDSGRPLVQQPEVAQQLLHSGLIQSRTIAGAWVICGGYVCEIDKCIHQAKEHENCAAIELERVAGQLAEIACFTEPEDGDADTLDDEKFSDEAHGHPEKVTIIVRRDSGDMCGTLEVIDTSTGEELKQLLASTFVTPPASEQELIWGLQPIHNRMTLSQQGIKIEAVLTMLHKPLRTSLQERLLHCHMALQSQTLVDAFSTSECSLRVASNLCGVGFDAAETLKPGGVTRTGGIAAATSGQKTLGVSSSTMLLKRHWHDIVLDTMCSMLDDARRLVDEASQERRPFCTEIVFHVSIQRANPNALDLPMGNLTEAARTLHDIPGDASLGQVITECVSALRYFYEEFLPVYLAWGSAAEAFEKTKLSVQKAKEVSAFVKDVVVMPLIANGDTDTYCSEALGATIAQVVSLGRQGVALAAPHVDRACLAAHHQLASILSSSTATTPGQRLQLIASLFECHSGPITHFNQVLAEIAGCLDCYNLASALKAPKVDEWVLDDCLAPMKITQLVVAAVWTFQSQCTQDKELDQAQLQLADSLSIRDSLLAWSPLRDGSGAQLAHAKALLLRLWGCFGAGSSCSQTLQQLFAWLTLAASLSSIVLVAQELAPWHEAVRKALARLQGLEGIALECAEDDAWANLRLELYRSGEPWLWLRLMGCEAPQEFYNRFGLEPEGMIHSGAAAVVGRTLAGAPGPADEVSPAEQAARLKAQEAAQLRVEAEARLKAKKEEEARLRAKKEADLQAEELARVTAEAEARLKADEENRVKTEEVARRQAQETQDLADAAAAEAKAAAAIAQAAIETAARAEEYARSPEARAVEDRLKRAEATRLRVLADQEEARLIEVFAAEQTRIKAQEVERLTALAEENDCAAAEEEGRLLALIEEDARIVAEEEAALVAIKEECEEDEAGISVIAEEDECEESITSKTSPLQEAEGPEDRDHAAAATKDTQLEAEIGAARVDAMCDARKKAEAEEAKLHSEELALLVKHLSEEPQSPSEELRPSELLGYADVVATSEATRAAGVAAEIHSGKEEAGTSENQQGIEELRSKGDDKCSAVAEETRKSIEEELRLKELALDEEAERVATEETRQRDINRQESRTDGLETLDATLRAEEERRRVAEEQRIAEEQVKLGAHEEDTRVKIDLAIESTNRAATAAATAATAIAAAAEEERTGSYQEGGEHRDPAVLAEKAAVETHAAAAAMTAAAKAEEDESRLRDNIKMWIKAEEFSYLKAEKARLNAQEMWIQAEKLSCLQAQEARLRAEAEADAGQQISDQISQQGAGQGRPPFQEIDELDEVIPLEIQAALEAVAMAAAAAAAVAAEVAEGYEHLALKDLGS